MAENIFISKDMILAKLNDPLLTYRTEVAIDLGIELKELYEHTDYYRVVKKNGVFISLDK